MKTLYKFGLIIALVGNVHAATVAPKITKISVTPASAPAGTMFKFTAEINNPLPEGYKVKIAPIGLTGFTTMISDAKNGYALSRAIYTTGKQKYKVVIVNAKNVTQGISKIGTYTVLRAAVSNKAPTLSLVKAENTATTNTTYTVTFNAKDVDGNLSSITMNWGDNSEPETLTATDSKDLVFSHIYTSASSFGWNAFASDKGSPVLNSKSISKIVTVSEPVVEVIAPPVKTTGYTKIANNGSELPDSAMLGTNPTDWACTKDNKTGLVWEVKTADGGLRDMNNLYTNYTVNYPKCDDASDGGMESCSKYYSGKYGDSTNTDGFVRAVNNQSLCGKNDWRLPTKDELMKLVLCSDGKYDSNGSCTNFRTLNSVVFINTTYFPNTPTWVFWSSSPAGSASNAWDVDFLSSLSFDFNRGDRAHYVRLVR